MKGRRKERWRVKLAGAHLLLRVQPPRRDSKGGALEAMRQTRGTGRCLRRWAEGHFWLFFAFVKYAKIMEAEKVDAIIAGLKEIEIRGKKLLANCAKHPRPAKSAPRRVPAPIRPVFKPAMRGTSSFADVAKGVSAPAQNPPQAVKLDCVKEVQEWADKCVLVGEVRNFDVLCNFPSLISLKGYDIVESKFVGGMQVAVEFRTARTAEVFKANKSIWLKWFIWVDVIGKVRSSPGRIAWLKIVGLPFLAWDEANFAAVARVFGKVLVDVPSFWNNLDTSSGKLCILMKSMKKLNEEVVVSLAGVTHSVGVIEVEDDWTPFRPFAAPSNCDTDEDEEEHSACSENIILEDGEFVPETQNGGNDAPSAGFLEKECQLSACEQIGGNHALHGEDGNGSFLEKGSKFPALGNDYAGHVQHVNSDAGHRQSPVDTNRPISSFPPPCPMPSFNSFPPPGPLPSFNSGAPNDGGSESALQRKIIKIRNLAKGHHVEVKQRPSPQPAFDLNRRASPSRSKLQTSDGFSGSNQVSSKSPSRSMDVEQTIEKAGVPN
ncbi:hypothetical protein LXL04_019101 [Taraxacum kok-saghyz]